MCITGFCPPIPARNPAGLRCAGIVGLSGLLNPRVKILTITTGHIRTNQIRKPFSILVPVLAGLPHWATRNGFVQAGQF